MPPQALCARRGRGRRRGLMRHAHGMARQAWQANELFHCWSHCTSCCRAAAAARRAAFDPCCWPTPWPMPAGQSISLRVPSLSAAAIASCLALNLDGLKRVAHCLLAHPSPTWKQTRFAAMAPARARPASTRAEQPVALHTYVADAAAAKPCTTELGLLPLPR